eukprot:CAMPEP_0183298846 /NCGR_PEP_ID=MMETSP0160_2-20130417/5739_1 /TAXON_ID=2839 ORGANISM="Odontella Sinensis, Strain Grunow 1884" /NCGR_SAMPLE_ID=MMETSP0160_2 /ASSEMBLY_ACC=CAM_ASM_000250 /LENGTH=111 /DNA_ID=CAMNT_0025460961 /DNA_START=814 /DNA_END=1149 /DNA_ORIENTATION=+
MILARLAVRRAAVQAPGDVDKDEKAEAEEQPQGLDRNGACAEPREEYLAHEVSTEFLERLRPGQGEKGEAKDRDREEDPYQLVPGAHRCWRCCFFFVVALGLVGSVRRASP